MYKTMIFFPCHKLIDGDISQSLRLGLWPLQLLFKKKPPVEVTTWMGTDYSHG